jgi:hypothetical protein
LLTFMANYFSNLLTYISKVCEDMFRGMFNLIHHSLCLALQIHIGFCILAAVAPPIVFKGKSLA